MRTLFLCALIPTLAGCTCLLPPQAGIEGCTGANGFACFDWTAARQPAEAEPAVFRPASTATKLTSTISERVEWPSSPPDARPRLAANPATSTAVAASTEPPASGQASETSDPVITKAKARIAAQLKNPASAEFVEMKRAILKNMVGERVDTICGRVKARDPSDEKAREWPFLYFVKKDDGFIVYGPAGSAAETAYRNICTKLKAPNATQTGQ